jgi:UDP-N-acetylglucosamine diphosphorylase / glucose-1-phosphate thymidylyltransferase / UDP-N-acetylgalactosamine diphosphorylase / glucosamine-1-phosphate N-acetyltransferase / galactosamine-1-phosphate N-acetyltransferase
MPVIIFEDAAVGNLEPLAFTRPAFDLRCGAGTLLQRQMRFFGLRAAGALVRPALAELCRRDHPELTVNEPKAADGPLTLVNARWLPPVSENTQLGAAEVGLVGEEVAYVRFGDKAMTPDGGQLDSLLTEAKQTLPHRPAGGRLMNYLWDLVDHNPEALREDAGRWRGENHFGPNAAAAVVGPVDGFKCHPSARIEPHVLVDTTRGPVLVDRDVVVQAFSRLEGPCYLGPETQVFAARIRGGTIGPNCRIGGEIEASIVHGYSNKYHDGFLGHSYLGEWVNFGAGTYTSDLRNDYGPITMPINGRSVPTGLMKIGAYVGDHTRTSIGTLMNTGTVIGPFGMLIASGSLLPRLIPAFSRYGHGRIQERTDLGQMFASAQAAQARRGREWTATDAEFYLALFDATAQSRRKIIGESEQRHVRRVLG